MRGLAILFMALTFGQNLIASNFPNEISSSEPPKMRSGFSQLRSNRDFLNSIGRRLAMVRFSETLRDESPEARARVINHIQEHVPPGSDITAEIADARGENAEVLFSEMQHFMAQEIRPNIILALRNAPDECILSAGFTENTQDPLVQAGFYIRFGQSLRAFELKNLAATSFLKSGLLYATATRTNENRIDLLLSAAQCYYWGYCNEQRPLRKEHFKTLYTSYFDYAHRDAVLSNDTELITRIEREKAKTSNARR